VKECVYVNVYRYVLSVTVLQYYSFTTVTSSLQASKPDISPPHTVEHQAGNSMQADELAAGARQVRVDDARTRDPRTATVLRAGCR